MNNIEKIYEESIDMKRFAKGYFNYLYKLLNQLDTDAIEAFAAEMEKTRSNHGTMFFVGNGGSAATASHMANDFGTNISKMDGDDLPFRAMSLTDNTSIMTAIANDDGYNNVFINQLRIHYRLGDVLVAISASGNSRNVVEAAEWVKKRGGTVMSLVGFAGGRLKEISDVVIHVESDKEDYGPVEDIHMIIDHLLANWLQNKIKQDKDE